MGVLVFVLGISQLAGSKWAIPEKIQTRGLRIWDFQGYTKEIASGISRG